jgi:transcriptional regulator with XRE-family HTH domain
LSADLNKTFARNLKALRHSRSLSSDRLAEELGFSQSGISDWELGKKMPRTENLQKIATFFHVTVPELFSDTLPAARVKNLAADEIIDLGAMLTPGVRMIYEGRILGQEDKQLIRRLIDATIMCK